MTFKAFIKTTFDHYKRTSKWDALVCLPVYGQEGALVGYLRPIIQDFRATDPHLAELLGQWRAQNPGLGSGTFEITTERTLKWLDTHIINREDRLLLLVEALDGTLVGHLGYSNFDYEEESAEVDSVVRGAQGRYPGMMSLAMQTLVHWGVNVLKLKKVKLSVFSDNEEAIRFYEKNGFRKAHQKALYRVELPGESKLELAPTGYDGPIEKYYLYMEYDLHQLSSLGRVTQSSCAP